jgi:hypothetical protein
MSTERLNVRPAIIPRVLAERLWGGSDLFLIDVGASGGIGAEWQVFGDRLRAVGFEPLVAEAERLQQRAEGSKLRYEAAFVTCRDFDQLFPLEVRHDPFTSNTNHAFGRVSALRALELMRMNYVQQVFNTGAHAQYADRRIVLDDYLSPRDRESVDFIKIDTDGHDFPVLLGTEGLLRAGGVLGFSVETWFNGAAHDHANTFSNIDRFLRSRGFSLFDLDVYRYSRAALPAPFVYDIAAQTVTGQVMWGEAVYFRDLATDGYEQMWAYTVTRERIVKLACLFDLFGLPDCAAELLIKHRDVLGETVMPLLNDLARTADTGLSYEEFIRRFEADPQQMYPSRRASGDTSQPPEAPPLSPAPGSAPAADAPPPAAAEAPRAPQPEPSDLHELRRRVERQQNKIAVLQERLRRRSARLEELTRARASDGYPGKSQR